MLTSLLLLKKEDPLIKPINEDLSIEINQTFDKDSINSIILIQYIEPEHPPVREFAEMDKQRDAAKKKNKNKDNNNTLLKIEIPSIWRERFKKDFIILN